MAILKNTFINDTGFLRIAVGTTAQRTTPQSGMLRYNSSAGLFEMHDGANWAFIGKTVAAGTIHLNKNTVTENITLPSGENGLSAGPITVNDGITVTVPDGQDWIIL
jgi:hypothetical protein